ncbi:ABC transporter ATP-binding protein [Jannaschia sp. R86511]|uniref:ABC transporter ATP-binding protein n=1 Tax=Jannaschia sp. R86511 TaxID=3093853 RepID=UPI0036D3BA12
MTVPAIELRALRHRYGDVEVLKGIDLTIAPGEIFGFLGHNGAGKTTAINILTTLLRPTSGSAAVFGHDVVRERAAVTARIGYLPAEVRLYGHMTALENLVFFGKLSGVRDARSAAHETLAYLGCRDLADLRVGSFSTGMRQRIGIAQAVLHRPDVLFLDEPTSGLDPVGVRQLRDTVLRLNQDLGVTVFMNTHLLSEVARVCSSIGVLNHGELIYQDSLAETLRLFPDEASLEDIYVRMEASPA